MGKGKSSNPKLPKNSSYGSKVAVNDDEPKQEQQQQQELVAPMANIVRIMRRTLPNYAKISDDSKTTIQQCVSEFINYITAEANDRCKREQRKTVMPEDVLWALDAKGFGEYVEPLSLYLQNHRDSQKDHGAPMLKRSRVEGPAVGMGGHPTAATLTFPVEYQQQQGPFTGNAMDGFVMGNACHGEAGFFTDNSNQGGQESYDPFHPYD